MASVCRYALLLLLLAATTCDASDYNILDLGMGAKFEQWMAEMGRVYKDEAEKARRYEIFKENVKYFEEFNGAGEYKHTLGLGPFTDLTTDEFLAMYTTGLQVPDTEVEESHRSVKHETAELLNATSEFDWRDKGVVSPIRYQGQCGSCWSFAVVATVESLTAITKGKLYDLSEQQLIDCDRNNNGCNGGWTGKAYEYIIRRPGLVTEATYPFTGVKGKCQAWKEPKAVADIGGYKYVPRNDEQALMMAVRQQPVAVAIDASNIKDYKSGVFHGPCGTKVNHAVAIVGYGQAEDGTKHWIVKNSWGDWWGEGGYIRMARDVAARGGLCGIAMWATYPTA